MKQDKNIASVGHSAARGTPRKAAAKPARAGRTAPQGCASAENRQCLIAEAAYYRAQARGFTPGYELEDWLQAEAEVNRLHACD